MKPLHSRVSHGCHLGIPLSSKPPVAEAIEFANSHPFDIAFWIFPWEIWMGLSWGMRFDINISAAHETMHSKHFT
jgi:hypothetical protein